MNFVGKALFFFFFQNEYLVYLASFAPFVKKTNKQKKQRKKVKKENLKQANPLTYSNVGPVCAWVNKSAQGKSTMRPLATRGLDNMAS